MVGIKVSLCLIVKNEEDHILNCLNSTKHIVDEIIVVDTGSTDDTVRRAREAGARVFFYPWNGNFSDARNYALQQATGSWILVLDADEVLAPIDREGFHALLANEQAEGYFLTIHSYQGSGREYMIDHVVRLFRNKPCYRFSGAIHEQVAPSILQESRGKGLQNCSLIIKHYGYLETEIKKKDKFRRNTSILLRELAKCPQDPFILYCLALEYYQRELVGQGLECLKKALQFMNGSEGYFEDVIVATANGLLNLGLSEELLGFTEKYLQILPENNNLHIFRGLGHMQAKKYAQAAEELFRSLGEEDNKFLPRHKHLCLLGDAFLLSGNVEQAVKFYLSALTYETGLTYPVIRIVDLLRKNKLTCEKLCAYMSADTLNKAGKQLIAAQQPYYAMLLFIFEIKLLFREPRQDLMLSQSVLEFYQIIHYQPFLQVPSFHYLCLLVRELYLCSLIIEKDYHAFIKIDERVSQLTNGIARLIVRDYCPKMEITGDVLGGDNAEKKSIIRQPG